MAIKKDAPAFRARIRMYRQGLGDCFLLTLPRQDRDPFYMLIDFGLLLGGRREGVELTDVVADLKRTTKGKLDVVAVTHEHWDHVSGFVEVKEAFKRSLTVGEVWMAWTEDPDDSLARKLAGEHETMRMGLKQAAGRLHVAGFDRSAHKVDGLLGFYGMGARRTTADAMKEVRKLVAEPRYCRSHEAPIEPEGVGARFFVLGPPTDEKLLRKCRPSKGEGYSLSARQAFLNSLIPGVRGEDGGAPFAEHFRIPVDVARQDLFFRNHYFESVDEAKSPNPLWRRIDNQWLDNAVDLALHLDSMTNNTSLVLAVELNNGDVLLFAGDAQVGNWRSWNDLRWFLPDEERPGRKRKVTGEDLLRRTVVYKTSHHGSENATMRGDGLELMDGLRYGLLPVDEETAHKRNWKNMPLPAIVERLEKKTGGRLVRMDGPIPAAAADAVTGNELYYELTIT